MPTVGIDIRNIGKKRTGDEVVFFNLVKSLAEIDNSNEYRLFTDITDENTLENISNDLKIGDKKNFQIIPLGTRNKFTWNFWTFQSYIRKNPVDVYLTQYITPFFVPKSTKIITIIHDISFNFYPRFIRLSDLLFLKILIPMSLRRADNIIGVSKFTHDEIIKYYRIDPEKISWIHNAVSDDFLNQDFSDEKMKIVKEKYGLPEKYILYLGTLQPRKNIPVLIEAYNLVKNKLGNAKLVIAGGKGHNFDKNIEKGIKKYALDKDVLMPGFVDEEDKAALMKSADVFVFPSFYEGFGIPVLEAMSVGTPVIASDIPPHKEIAEKAALFFNPNNFQELAKKLTSLVGDENLKQELIINGLEKVKKFSWQKTAGKMVGIFKSLA
jgi:glycosyltransferase involved in cell wall biosynthesis